MKLIKTILTCLLFVGMFQHLVAQTPGAPYFVPTGNVTSNGSAVISAFACATASAGTLTTGTPVSAVTQTITATVASAGNYSISATTNGVTFTGTGTFIVTGAQSVVLTATGTPTVSGAATFTLNTTPNCNFSRTVFDATASNLTVSANVAFGFSTEDMIVGVANVATNTYTVNLSNDVLNNATTLAFSPSDLILSGASSGNFTVTVSPSSATILPGTSQTITYTITGTPSLAGTLTASWSKNPLTNSGTKTVKNLSDVVATTTSYTGSYLTMTPLSSSAVTPTFKVILTNNATRTLSFPAPVVGNVAPSISNTPSQTVTVSAVSPSTTFTLATGASSTLTYTLACATAFINGENVETPWTYSTLTTNTSKPILWLDLNTTWGPPVVSGTYIVGVPMVASTNKYGFTITNNTLGYAVNNITAPLASNVTINGGSSIGITVAAPTPAANYNLAVNGVQAINYPFSGTPTVAGDFPVQLNYVNNGFQYANIGATGLSVKTVSDYLVTTPVFSYTGNYISNTSLTGHTVKITITNNTGSTTPTLPAPSISNLTFGGTTGLSVSSVSPSTSYTLAAGASTTFTYTLSGTPTGSPSTLNVNWTYGGGTYSDSRSLTAGSATFSDLTNTAFVFSANASGVNVAGTLPIGTTVALPYTAGLGSYAAFTSPDVAIPSQFCNDGASNWTFGYSYSAGTFATSGAITATLITKKGGVVTAWPAFQVTNLATINYNCVAAPLVINGVTFSNTVGINEGGDAIRGELTTSAASYDAAAAGEWVAVTNAEYVLLQSSPNLSGAGTYLTADSVLATSSPSSNAFVTVATEYSTIPSEFVKVPASNYIYAYRFKTPTSGATAGNGIVRYNSFTATGNYTALGTSGGTAGRLPNQIGAITGDTFYCFVIKRPTQITTSSGSTFVSISVGLMGYMATFNNGGSRKVLTGDNSNMFSSTSNSGLGGYQVLATPTKLW